MPFCTLTIHHARPRAVCECSGAEITMATRGRRTGGRSEESTSPGAPGTLFQQDLLAAVYATSGDLWHVLRDRCHDVTSWLQHLEYEGDIERDGSFNAATKLIPSWPNTEAQLQQARNLLGKQVWDSLTSRAATKGMEGRGSETTASNDAAGDLLVLGWCLTLTHPRDAG